MLIKSKAKINLFLKIYGKNAEYHFLHSLVAFCENIYDEITINTAINKNDLEICYSEFSTRVPQENNILWQVLKNYEIKTKFHIKLKKNIPVAAGLGGGSSNAAMLLKFLLNNTSQDMQDIDLSTVVRSLGSDVPVCLSQCASYVSSYGEEVQLSPLPAGIWAVLVNPNLEVPTGEVFKNFNFNENNYLKHYPSFKTRDELFTFLKSLNNDLEQVTIKLVPEIAIILSAINSSKNCILARMSGSGATCFGLFNSENDAIKAKNQLKKFNQNWWIKETLLI